jgi:hypothetical protein
MATKRYTQRELEVFVRCWQTATNLEGLVAALKEHPEHRTSTEEWETACKPSGKGGKLFTDEERAELESDGWTVTQHTPWWQTNPETYEKAYKNCSTPLHVDWAKRRGHIMRRRGVRLKYLGESNGPSGVSYASLNAVASEY